MEFRQQEPAEEKLIDFPRKRRPQSLNEDTMRSQRMEVNVARVIEQEKREKEERLAILQRELKQMEETELRINGTLDPPGTAGLQLQGKSAPDQRPVRHSMPSYGMTFKIENRKQNDQERR